MLLSLLLLVLLFALAVYQSKFGLYSGFLMTVLTLCCAAAAFGTYEWAAGLLAQYWKPDYANSVALGVLFGVPLLILRVVFDKAFRRACPVSSWAERAGGVVCGLVTALVTVGVLGVAVKMIPFGVSIVGYSAVEVSPQPDKRKPDSKPLASTEKEDKNLLLSPDRFAVATAAVLADGVFSGRNNFSKYNPDLVQAVGWVGAVPMDVTRFARPKSISLDRTEPVEFVYRLIPGETDAQPPTYERETPKGGMEFRMVRVQLQQTARQDARKPFAATLRQFRLVGQRSANGEYEQHFPVAMQDERDLTRHIKSKKTQGQVWPVVDDVFVPLGDDRKVEMVFELPKGFKPFFVEYKRAARAAVSFDDTSPRSAEVPASPQPAERTAAAPETPSAPATAPASASGRKARAPRPEPESGRNPRARGVAAKEGGSRFSDELPVTMTAYRGVNAEISKGTLSAGHLVGEVALQAGGKDPPVSKFNVPQDKRLLQLNSVRLQARSTLGKAMSQAITTVQNYYVEDTNGRRFVLAGKYVLADVGGQKVIEIQYFPESGVTMGGIGAFERVKERDLKPDDEFVLLFLVDPGARIVGFSSGGPNTRKDDLTAEELTAPK